jgi:hypothetical protein
MTPDYHDYVVKDGQFIGQFEEMYRACDDPWDASKEDYDASACSVAAKHFIHSRGNVGVLSLGSGTGRHVAWLDCDADGVEISETAALQATLTYPWQWVAIDSMLHFLATDDLGYDVYLFREVLWYVLPDLEKIWTVLSAKPRASVIVELSFYNNQRYGRDFFDGPDDFVAKWPFGVEQIVQEYTTRQQQQGRLMIAGKVR